MVVATYRVSGMTCAHCEQAVATELSAVPGVTNVDVDLATGEVTVSSDDALALADVEAAVDEAGYQLAT